MALSTQTTLEIAIKYHQGKPLKKHSAPLKKIMPAGTETLDPLTFIHTLTDAASENKISFGHNVHRFG